MKKETLDSFREHVKEEYPREACGLIIVTARGREKYIRAKNISSKPQELFTLDPHSYATAEDMGSIIGICHSHPNASAKPSEGDLASCEASKKTWHILSWPENELYTWDPTNVAVPLVGRPFHYGILDCCTLVRDYYKQNLDIEFECYSGEDGWWDEGESRYLDNYKEQGFVRVRGKNNFKKHDIFLIKLVSPVPNHAAVYIGDGRVLHHVHGRLSNRELYGGYWIKHTTHHLRHISLC